MNLTDQLSPHFRAYELAQHDGGVRTLPGDEGTRENLQRLVSTVLEPLRLAWEQYLHVNTKGGSAALRIVSGWRSVAQNARIGGAGQSQHCLGKAADVSPDVDVKALRHGHGTTRDQDRMQDFAEFCERYVDRGDVVGGFGIYPGWCHLDIRPRGPGNHIAKWFGHTVGSEK
jgi:hypothetical protein